MGRRSLSVGAPRCQWRGGVSGIVTDDPDECVAEIEPYLALGFTHLVFHFPGKDQERAMKRYAAEVLPRLRKRA